MDLSFKRIAIPTPQTTPLHFNTIRSALRRANRSVVGAVIAIILCCVSSLAQNQSPPEKPKDSPPNPANVTPVQVDNAESNAKLDSVQIPEANPARPTITNPAHIPPVGYLQLEQGFTEATQSPDSLKRQFSLNQSMKLAVHPRLMFEFPSQPFAATRFSASPDTPPYSTRDAGDLQLGVQGILYKESGLLPTFSLGYVHRVRSGSAPDIDVGSFDQSAIILISGDAGDFHYDTNFVVSEQTSDPIRRAQYGQTLSVTHDLFPESLQDKLELTGELWHFSQPLVATTTHGSPSPRSNAVGTLWALGYAVLPNLVLDVAIDHGLTSTSTAWQTFGGFTYLVPHRLWPHRTPPVLPTGPKKHIHRH